MKNQHNAIDGITLRRRTSVGRGQVIDDTSVPTQFLNHAAAGPTRRDSLPPVKDNRLKRSDIDESLQKFDSDKGGKKPRNWRARWKFFKRVVAALLIIAVLIGGYVGVKALIAGSHIFGGNLLDALSQQQALKSDANGRSNIVIFGTSEDDTSPHSGASLTDSIMLMSIDQKTNQVMLTSVPRDLWVNFDSSCQFGDAGKINVVYECGAGSADLTQNSDVGAHALMQKVGEVYGLSVQYYVHVNYSGLEQAVDAVGGVNITIDSPDLRGILDRNFDWQCDYKCYLVKYPNGPVHLDGKQALYLARARNDSGGYGLPAGNFDREQNQQKILIALRDKAASAGTLANPIAATQLIDSLGNNVRTNFAAGEIKTLIGIAKNVKDSNIDRIDFDTAPNIVLTTGNYDGQSIVEPTSGLLDYSDIQAIIKQHLSSDPVVKENASIVVLNGSGVSGAASATKDTLEGDGFTVSSVGNATTSPTHGAVTIYKLSSTKQPATTSKLEATLKAKVQPGPLPFGMTSTADFVVIVGQ